MIQAVLFDLDGTLADTAPDLGNALNRQRTDRGLAPLPIEQLRPMASQGARGLLRIGFGLTPEHPQYAALRDEFLSLYEAALCRETTLFNGMPELLQALEARRLPWGVVTNKQTRYTRPLLQQLGLEDRAACVVSGDTTPHIKPHPAPLLAAAAMLELHPARCLYVGDDRRDVQAAHAAGMRAAVALYGYLGDGGDPANWGASHHIEHPLELLNFLPAAASMG